MERLIFSSRRIPVSGVFFALPEPWIASSAT
jgi:hypothetical protein